MSDDRQRTFSTVDFITELFCRVDDALADVPKHPQAQLWPGELVTLGLLFALKGTSERAFYRWADRDLRPLFPNLPERTRLFRLLAAHRDWADRFLAPATLFGVADSFGIELIQTRRLGRSDKQIAKKGFCGGRWIAGVKLGAVVNSDGQVCSWDVATANTYDATAFGPLIRDFDQRMIVLADGNFHANPKRRRERGQPGCEPDPPNLKLCPRGRWYQRMLVETVFSMMGSVMGLKRLGERTWKHLRSHLAYLTAAFNLLLSWDGPPKMAIARFSL